jgi:hypothetical protein
MACALANPTSRKPGEGVGKTLTPLANDTWPYRLFRTREIDKGGGVAFHPSTERNQQ